MSQGITVLHLVATALTDDLHIDSGLVELDKLITGEISLVAVLDELVLRDNDEG